MPFRSKAQMRAAFGGYLGAEMKAKARTWAAETPDPKRLPTHVHQHMRNRARRQALLQGLKGGER